MPRVLVLLLTLLASIGILILALVYRPESKKNSIDTIAEPELVTINSKNSQGIYAEIALDKTEFNNLIKEIYPTNESTPKSITINILDNEQSIKYKWSGQPNQTYASFSLPTRRYVPDSSNPTPHNSYSLEINIQLDIQVLKSVGWDAEQIRKLTETILVNSLMLDNDSNIGIEESDKLSSKFVYMWYFSRKSPILNFII